jgi:hypothetical protein
MIPSCGVLPDPTRQEVSAVRKNLNSFGHIFPKLKFPKIPLPVNVLILKRFFIYGIGMPIAQSESHQVTTWHMPNKSTGRDGGDYEEN